jgi:hypothetical protein
MCCFSQQVDRVSNTSIFARGLPAGRQLLVYEMTVASRLEVSMVLPLPVPPAPAEDAVRFIDLESYPTFFTDLRSGFPVPLARGGPQSLSFAPAAVPKLVVHDVGAFEASFVPRAEDFDRLDPRFRLPAQTWDALPNYRDWGFAVFKLKGLSATPKPIHPMAFDFPRRDPAHLFFPTVHIHDGAVHATAPFDHPLYFQSPRPPADWETSYAEAKLFASERAFTLGILEPRERCSRRILVGHLPNRDTYVADTAA